MIYIIRSSPPNNPGQTPHLKDLNFNYTSKVPVRKYIYRFLGLGHSEEGGDIILPTESQSLFWLLFLLVILNAYLNLPIYFPGLLLIVASPLPHVLGK